MGDHDISIVGGGPVGLFLGLAAAQSGRSVVVLESRKPDQDLDDRRAIALSWGSVLKLVRLGVDLRADPLATPIRTIHVSRTREPGRTVLSAAEAGVPALGIVVSYGAIVGRLRALARSSIDVRYDTTVQAIESTGGHASVCFANGSLESRVAVIADGGGALLESAGFRVTSHEYGLHALVGRLRCDLPATDIAYERFSGAGPIALLPDDGEYALIWTVPPERAAELRQCDSLRFIGALQTEFGWRAGRFVAVRDRGTYPLRARKTLPLVRDRVVAIGNAAQVLHPVAGQGLNLGLRDAWALVDRLRHEDGDAPMALKRYAADRRTDRELTMGFTDALARGFALDAPGLGVARSAALEFLDLVPAARRVFARTLSLATHR